MFRAFDPEGEARTVACATDCNTDPLTLSLLEQLDYTIDGRRNVVRDKRRLSSTNYIVTDRTFLDRGLLECSIVRMNVAVLPSSITCTLGTPGTDGPDRITKNVYDNAGELLKVQKAYLVTTANGFPKTLQQDYVTYAYTPNGKQQFITDANGNKAQYTWDGFDRLSKWNFPSPTTAGTVSATDYEQYTYDNAGNRLSLRRRDGRTLTFAYDNLNRMLSKLIPDGCPPIQPPGTGCPPASATRDVFYGYDLLGRQLTARFDSTSGADGITNAYDGFGNLTSSSISMAGFSKAVTSLYDLDNNRTRVTHPDAQAFTYAYDARDRLSGVYEGVGTGTPLDTFAFNPDDTLASRSENGTGAGSAAYTYDAIGRLATQSDTFPAFTTKNVGWTFGVSPASQIISETRTNDAYAFTGIATANKNYSVNGLNQYSAVGGTSHTYDASGNLTGDGTNAYIYDGENRLVSATAAGVTTTLTYDPLGRLWQVAKGSANTRFLYDGDALVGEYDASGILTNRYVHGSNVAADDPLLWYVGSGTGTKRFLHADHLGSIVAAANGATTPSVNTYDEYGVPGASNVGRFQYTGQILLTELGSSVCPGGLYHYKARIYSPCLGRFLQVDPTGYDNQLNLYSYVNDDPLNFFDYDGEGPIGWVVRLTEFGFQKVRPLFTKSAAAAARRGEKNVLITKSRQMAGQVERAGNESKANVMRHSGHQLEEGKKGLPHFQTEGKAGHTFYGTLSSLGAAALTILEAYDKLTDPIAALTPESTSACDTFSSGCSGVTPVKSGNESTKSEGSKQDNRSREWSIEAGQITGNRAQGTRICPRGDDFSSGPC